ncbi:MAG: sigma-E factor negative regulatory protein [Comamonas sp.]
MKKELDLASHGDPLRAQVSALVDGEALHVEPAVWPALARDDALLASWADYQRIGDALRGGSPLAGQGNEMAFLATFRERLAADQAAAQAPAGNVLPFPTSATSAISTTSATPAAALPLAAREASNDGIYRWKMVAGLATVMAVLVVGWTALEEPSVAPASASGTQEMAVQSPAAAAVTLASTAPVAGTGTGASSSVALLPQGGLRRVSQPGLVVARDAAGSRYALQAVADGSDSDSVMIRDAQLDEFLAAHRQGSASALQTPVDFVRDAVVQPAP